MQKQSLLVLDLAAIDRKMLPLVGGKAGNLGELIRAGLPTPPGVCVTTEAYREVAAAASIDFDALAGAGPDEVKRLALEARNAVLNAPIPAAVEAAVIAGYERLGAGTPVAVRSSATAEDLPNASFAGQQDTFLHIVGAAEVIKAVRRCWASLWTDRAVVYRSTNGIDHRSVRLAVVIQEMIEAEIAGVLFTANPVTGRRRQAVIDANPGLGEAVVSGAVNPDHFVVNTDAGEIVERRLGDKRLEIRSTATGGVQHIERPSGSDRACVTDDQILALAALGARVEAHYGSPQDTEWAIDAAGKIWLTQARPITTLFPIPSGAASHNLGVYLCFSLAQGLQRPITPAGLAGFRLFASSAARLFGIHVEDPHAGPPVYAEAGQRLFVDLTGILRGRVGRALMPRLLDVMEARSAALLRSLFDDPRLSITRRTPFLFLRRVLKIASRYGVPLRVMESLARPAAAHARIERFAKQLEEGVAPRESAGIEDRIDFAERILGSEMIHIGPKTMPAAAAGLAMLGLAGKLLGADALPGDLQAVLRGLPHNVTTEMDLTLWDLATRIRGSEEAAALLRDELPAELARRFQLGALPRPLQEGLTEFLKKYGHRGVAEIDLGMPRWSDDPTYILGVLSNYLRLDNPELAPTALFTKGAAEAEGMVETLVGRARLRGALRARLTRFALNRTRQLAGLREAPKYYMIVALAAVRRELAEVGSELSRRGLIENVNDVFFLDLREIRSAARGQDQREVVRERRQAYDTELRRRHIPNVLLSDGTEPSLGVFTSDSSSDLHGTPASAGSITGVARVILDPVGARLEPGEILVAPSTDPGWTPLFLTAGGLVMEMGGANSHGAVVAREYGIPAVVGALRATTRIATGDRISVDGSTGTVRMIGETTAQ